MKEVVFVLSKKYEYLDELVEKLKADGIVVSYGNVKTEGALVITDCSDGIDKNRPYIFYENDDNKILKYSDCLCVIQGFDEIDTDFLVKKYQRFLKIPWTIAETDRLKICEMTIEDIDQFYKLYNDLDIQRFCQPLKETKEEEIEFEKAYIDKMYGLFEYGTWNLVRKDDGLIIGRAGLNIRDGMEGLELGYLIDKSCRNKGYAYEACKEIIKYAEEKLYTKEIYCLISEDNTNSLGLAKKLGFIYEKNITIGNKSITKFTLV